MDRFLHFLKEEEATQRRAGISDPIAILEYVKCAEGTRAGQAFWSLMWGGIGAFIAVPLTVVIMIVCSEIPGLQPFARLLSSDGVLPKEQNIEVDNAVDDAPSFVAKPSSRKDGNTAAVPKQSHSVTEEELELIKQELLERKEARQRKSEPSRSANSKPDTR